MRLAAGIVLLAAAAAGCGAAADHGGTTSVTHTVVGHTTVQPARVGATARRARRHAARSRATARIAALTRAARARYKAEVTGAAVHKQVRRVAADPVLLGALRANDRAALSAEVTRQLYTHGAHIVRLRVVRGPRVLADAGGDFVVAPAQRALRDPRGRWLGTLQVSIQDVIGYVRYMQRNFPVDVLVRGNSAARMKTSLAGVAPSTLPRSGSVTIGGRRYRVRSFRETGFAREPLRVWILTRA